MESGDGTETFTGKEIMKQNRDHPRNFEQDLLNRPRPTLKFNLHGSRGVCSKDPVEKFLETKLLF